MNYLNYEFFEEFKALDNLCREIYGDSIDNKLGVTLYLEDMDRNYCQGVEVPGWKSDYNKLKSVRNIRNELAHSRNTFSVDICSQEDIDFICSFRERILNQTDPIAMLMKETTSSHTSQSNQQSEPIYIRPTLSKTPSGCLGVVASFLVVVACIIAFLL
jgi:hypothetical protein